MPETTPILRAAGVSAGYGGGRRSPDVLHDVDLEVWRGRTVGVVGESGSGKSTLARVLVGQLRASAGQVLLDGVDTGTLKGASLRAARRRMQLIPQDPYASLDPRMTIRRALAEAIDPDGRHLGRYDERIEELLRTVALDPDIGGRFPHEFSGGQRQRIAIARALAVEPAAIIADEVTSSLDASVQAEILNLLRDIQRNTGVGIMFITHDLSVANFICDEISVLYLGRVVEHGLTDLLFRPDHHYTRLLVDSIPSAEIATGASVVRVEDPADPAHPPSGCPFHPRCPAGPVNHVGREMCFRERPPLTLRRLKGDTRQSRATACHFPLLSESTTAFSLNNHVPTMQFRQEPH